MTAEPSPYHQGEREVQERVGSREIAERLGKRMIRGFLPDQHRELFAQLPFVILGSVSGAGDLTASVIAGEPGFISTPTDRSIRFGVLPSQDDPLHANLVVGAQLGILGIELPTRRRNRANGVVTAVDETGFLLSVDQSFGNCPKYIHPRNLLASAELAGPLTESPTMDSSTRAIVEAADTFFVASRSAATARGSQAGLDVSHRGGAAGFVSVQGNSLLVPDYTGNNMFNTLGNFAANPTAGLLFIDFDSGALLQVSGSVELLWDGPELAVLRGALRAWRLRIESVRFRPAGAGLRGTS